MPYTILDANGNMLDGTWTYARGLPGEAFIDATDPRIAAYAASKDPSTTVNARASAQALATDPAAPSKLLRAALFVTLDEINTLRDWLMSFQAAVAAATSLANLQTRVAALPALPDRTPAQAQTAIQNKISGGAAD